jgi:hypothetical protein
VLLIDVLKGLGGASQEDQQPALVLGSRFFDDPQKIQSSNFSLLSFAERQTEV